MIYRKLLRQCDTTYGQGRWRFRREGDEDDACTRILMCTYCGSGRHKGPAGSEILAVVTGAERPKHLSTNMSSPDARPVKGRRGEVHFLCGCSNCSGNDEARRSVGMRAQTSWRNLMPTSSR